MPEVLAISDRIVTMREGRVTGEILRAAATQEKLMSMMTLMAPQSGGAGGMSGVSAATLGATVGRCGQGRLSWLR
jgi:hypothetical protein